MSAKDLRRSFFALSDLTKGNVRLETVLEWGLDELEEWLEDALEWRREVNKAMSK